MSTVTELTTPSRVQLAHHFTELTDSEEALLLLARLKDMCVGHGRSLTNTEEELLELRRCAKIGIAPPLEIVQRAVPKVFLWLTGNGLSCSLEHVRRYLSEEHRDDVTPYRRCTALCRIRPQGKEWRVRTQDEGVVLRVPNMYDLPIAKDGDTYRDVDVHCTTAGGMLVGGIIFGVID